ncbi:hypothetical protein OEG84_12475 [Hoeflea sp. G2-23]|uniref:Uncharacterized protein n=1 Tax=Hoeflea algicola TaxID=2983763 RepID=A0ABT3Z9R7_9HYPH|nr:hypothetical protein [Hoeflea algicola]MCY0148508.1 hypothetical protein [Hoeflea algicola]
MRRYAVDFERLFVKIVLDKQEAGRLLARLVDSEFLTSFLCIQRNFRMFLQARLELLNGIWAATKMCSVDKHMALSGLVVTIFYCI